MGDSGLSLLDVLSPPYTPDVTLGREELELLVDHIAVFLEDTFFKGKLEP